MICIDYLEIPKLRLERAMEHINEFRREASAFLETSPFGVIHEFYDEGGQKFIEVS